MFSVAQKREIANQVQAVLRGTGHPELPAGEISFTLLVSGAESWSWAKIQNNGAITNPGVNPHNEWVAEQMKANVPTLLDLARETEAVLHDAVLHGFDAEHRARLIKHGDAVRTAVASAEGIL